MVAVPGILHYFFKRRIRINPLTIANIIERFVNGKSSEWEWDNFISSPIKDRLLDKIRIHCSQLDKEYPPEKLGEYTNERGLEVLRQYVKQLRTGKTRTNESGTE